MQQPTRQVQLADQFRAQPQVFIYALDAATVIGLLDHVQSVNWRAGINPGQVFSWVAYPHLA